MFIHCAGIRSQLLGGPFGGPLGPASSLVGVGSALDGGCRAAFGPLLGPRLAVLCGGRPGGSVGVEKASGNPADTAAVALELERLRGTMEAGFARVDGALALLVQRSDQSDRHLGDHERRLASLERSRWPLPSLAVLIALLCVVIPVWQATAAR